jgi:hypothetical protein
MNPELSEEDVQDILEDGFYELNYKYIHIIWSGPIH